MSGRVAGNLHVTLGRGSLVFYMERGISTAQTSRRSVGQLACCISAFGTQAQETSSAADERRSSPRLQTMAPLTAPKTRILHLLANGSARLTDGSGSPAARDTEMLVGLSTH